MRYPGEFMSHIDTLSEGLAMKIMYGIDVKSGDDPLITLAKSVSNIGDRLVSPQYIAVIKYCPFLMSVPRWVPLLGPVRRLVEASNEYLQEFREQPMQRLKESGMGAEGIIPRLLQEAAIGNAKSEAYIRQVKDMATIVTLGTHNKASADTTLSSTGTFFLAMANNARPQEIAQREIDMVVGKGHLPTPNDRPNLPYVEAIYQEVLTTLSTGLPHMASQSDSYRGHYIPRGTIVMANIWAMTHDENVYPDPYEFKPERFLDKTVTINDILAYGFGRRVCVGRHLADTVLRWTFACVLACFDIRKETDEKGNEIDIPERYSPGPGVFSHPLPFRCRIIPRHAGVESLVSETPPPE
ncbi:hypothetical protein VNI00_010712 [Paramarasmius palmivorus]|uniref:Cytochrome P450 n=1 Tax=Paramarasmius palmivorus TaxID=297713 RepID=A0AAW0CF97_9AGAR